MLDHEIESGKIRFAEGQGEIMAQRVKKIVASLYHVHTFVNGTPCLTDTSSSNHTQQFRMPNTPGPVQVFTPGPSQPSSTGKMTSNGNQGYIVMNQSNVSAMNLNTQPQFTGIASQIPRGIAFQQPSLSYIGNHLSAVPGSSTAQNVDLTQQGFDFNFDPNMNWEQMTLGLAHEHNEHDLDYVSPSNNNRNLQ